MTACGHDPGDEGEWPSEDGPVCRPCWAEEDAWFADLPMIPEWLE